MLCFSLGLIKYRTQLVLGFSLDVFKYRNQQVLFFSPQSVWIVTLLEKWVDSKKKIYAEVFNYCVKKNTLKKINKQANSMSKMHTVLGCLCSRFECRYTCQTLSLPTIFLPFICVWQVCMQFITNRTHISRVRTQWRPHAPVSQTSCDNLPHTF